MNSKTARLPLRFIVDLLRRLSHYMGLAALVLGFLWSGPVLPAQAAEASPAPRGIPSAQPRAAIGADNVAGLTMTAQWGKGAILGVAFAPDGRSFVVGSALGLAIYDLHEPGRPPRWLPFPSPYWYDRLCISQDGSRVRLEADKGQGEVVLADGHLERGAAEQVWLRPADWALAGQDLVVNAPDGRRQFRSHVKYVFEEAIDVEEVAIREMRDRQARQTLYALTDPAPYVSVLARSEPEGCELSHFSYCGNAWTPVLAAPEQGAFAPDGGSFAVLYRLYSDQYSAVRVYDAADGTLRLTFGGFSRPVRAFAYSPDGRQMLVAYTDGAVQLWDLDQGQLAFSAWHFNGPSGAVAYTADSRYLLVERAGLVEIRRSRDGALRGRYPAVTYAAAPSGDLVALGGSDGAITLLAAGSGQVVRRIEAHRDRVFALAFSPDGRWLASSSQDCTIRLWDAATGEFLHLFEETIVDAYGEGFTASRIFIRGLRFVPGRNQLVGFGSWGTAVSWNVDSGARQYVVESAPLEYYTGMITLNPHFPEFFGADVEHNLFYINNQGYTLDTGKVAGNYQPPAGLPEGCAGAGPRSADGRLMFTVGRETLAGQICVLDAHDLRLIETLAVTPGLAERREALGWLYLSPDGGQLVATGVSGELYIFQTPGAD